MSQKQKYRSSSPTQNVPDPTSNLLVIKQRLQDKEDIPPSQHRLSFPKQQDEKMPEFLKKLVAGKVPGYTSTPVKDLPSQKVATKATIDKYDEWIKSYEKFLALIPENSADPTADFLKVLYPKGIPDYT